MLKKPQNVYMPIDRLQAKVLKRKDPVKKAEWVDNFVLALSEEAEDPFAKELLEKAQFDYYKDILRTWRLKAKKSISFNGNEPSDKQIHEWCCEEYGDEYIEALHLLSKNSKRFSKKIQNLLSNNPQDAPNGNDQGTAGDAPHREAGENLLTPGNGSASGIANVSDDALAEGGGNGNVPLDMHGGSDSAALESGTPSAEVDVYSMPPSPSAAQAKSLAYRGAFGNVRLTDLQYAELGLKFGNKVKLDRAIDSLSAKIENGEEKPKNHFATLVKWSSYRADIEEKESKPRGSNMDLHNYEVGRKLGLLP